MCSAETAAVERNGMTVIMHFGEKCHATVRDNKPPLMEKKCCLKSEWIIDKYSLPKHFIVQLMHTNDKILRVLK